MQDELVDTGDRTATEMCVINRKQGSNTSQWQARKNIYRKQAPWAYERERLREAGRLLMKSHAARSAMVLLFTYAAHPPRMVRITPIFFIKADGDMQRQVSAAQHNQFSINCAS